MNNGHKAKRGTDPCHKPQELNLWIEGSLLCLTFIDINTFLPFLSFFCTPLTLREPFWNELNSYYVPGILLETEGVGPEGNSHCPHEDRSLCRRKTQVLLIQQNEDCTKFYSCSAKEGHFAKDEGSQKEVSFVKMGTSLENSRSRQNQFNHTNKT